MVSTAIILDQTRDTRFLIFSREHGLHHVFCHDRNGSHLFRGSVIAYECVWYKQRVVIHNATIAARPAVWVQENIWFFHHVIELLKTTLCYEQPEPCIFRLLYQLYRTVEGSSRDAQLVFLARLFFLLGIQPENLLHLESLMQYVAQHSFSQLLHDSQYTYDELYEWIIHCVRVCEQYQSLQTKSFYEMRGI